jgi:hypothetical protein
MFLPKQVSIPAGVGIGALEGYFSSDIAIKKSYTYLALENPYIMNLVYDVAKLSVAIIKHHSDRGNLMIV